MENSSPLVYFKFYSSDFTSHHGLTNSSLTTSFQTREDDTVHG